MFIRSGFIGVACLLTVACASTPAPVAEPSQDPDAAMREACTGASAVQYGVAAAKITLDPAITPAADGGFELAGSVEKGSEGIKQLKCRFDANRKLFDVMAMTPDGE